MWILDADLAGAFDKISHEHLLGMLGGFPAKGKLKTWRILRKLRCCPWRAGQLAKAIHALQIREANAG